MTTVLVCPRTTADCRREPEVELTDSLRWTLKAEGIATLVATLCVLAGRSTYCSCPAVHLLGIDSPGLMASCKLAAHMSVKTS